MKTVVIQAKNGLHARPAAELVKLAGTYPGEIFIEKGEKSASAKSMMRLMSLGIRCGDEVRIRADQEEDPAIVDQLAELLENME